MDDLLTPLLLSALTKFATEEARSLMHMVNPPPNTVVTSGMSRGLVKNLEPALNKDLNSSFYMIDDVTSNFNWEPSVTVDIDGEYL